jgi:hypothetical protein
MANWQAPTLATSSRWTVVRRYGLAGLGLGSGVSARRVHDHLAGWNWPSIPSTLLDYINER